jgi:hypothetical protein
MKKLILIALIATTLLTSCTHKKVYTVRSVTGFETETDMDLSTYKIGDKVLLLKYPGDIKHNEFVELTIIAIK